MIQPDAREGQAGSFAINRWQMENPARISRDDPMEAAKRLMKRLAEMPPTPHKRSASARNQKSGTHGRVAFVGEDSALKTGVVILKTPTIRCGQWRLDLIRIKGQRHNVCCHS